MSVQRAVTAHIDAIDFLRPVPLGSVCSVFCKIAKEGRTSITIDVLVTVSAMDGDRLEDVVRTQMVFVSVDENGQPKPWR